MTSTQRGPGAGSGGRMWRGGGCSSLLSTLWVSRTGSASDWCALQEALYKYIDTMQYNTIQAQCGRPYRQFKLESTDVIIVFFSCKEVGVFFLPEFRLCTEKKWKFVCDIN